MEFDDYVPMCEISLFQKLVIVLSILFCLILAVAVSLDGKHIVSGSADNTINV